MAGVSTVFLNIHSEERFNGTPPKEVLYLDVGIAQSIFYDAFCPLDTFSKKKKRLAFCVVCRFPKCREGEVPPLKGLNNCLNVKVWDQHLKLPYRLSDLIVSLAVLMRLNWHAFSAHYLSVLFVLIQGLIIAFFSHFLIKNWIAVQGPWILIGSLGKEKLVIFSVWISKVQIRWGFSALVLSPTYYKISTCCW